MDPTSHQKPEEAPEAMELPDDLHLDDDEDGNQKEEQDQGKVMHMIFWMWYIQSSFSNEK